MLQLQEQYRYLFRAFYQRRNLKVVRLEKFGAFVNLFGNTDGLLHISKISHHRVDKVEDVLKLGDIIDVKVTEIDNKGRINVSAKALLPKPKTEEEKTEA